MKAGDKAGGMTGGFGGWDPAKTAAKKTTQPKKAAAKKASAKKTLAVQTRRGGGHDDRDEALGRRRLTVSGLSAIRSHPVAWLSASCR